MHLNLIAIVTLLSTCWIASSTECTAQTVELNGLYIILDDARDCPNRRPTVNNKTKKYCVSQRPIISAVEFESISQVIIDSIHNQKMVILKLSKNGFNTWKGVIKNFPNSSMALIIDGFAAGTFKNKEGEIPSFNIPINGPINSTEVDWIYEHLKKTSPIDKKD
ncbi:MAG TPA: hypothetical protein VIM65_22665 [Cyclobacteriaceae bacterium]